MDCDQSFHVALIARHLADRELKITSRESICCRRHLQIFNEGVLREVECIRMYQR